jgi:multisite-specific tRNA:(cytosine-C5)-methyltransferase
VRGVAGMSAQPLTPGCRVSALSLRLFGEDVTAAAREAGKKKRHAASSSSAPNEPADDKDEDADADDDDMDAEEQEH